MDIEKLLKEKIQLVTDYRKESTDDIENFMFLKRDLSMNDYEIKDLIIELEKTFNIDISDKILKDFMTVSDVAKYLKTKINKE